MKDLILDHKDNWRMYGLVPYNISSIQQGIQFGHAVVEYGLQYGNVTDNVIARHLLPEDSKYTKWAKEDKTFIILNGGTTNKRLIDGVPFGSLNQHVITLKEMGVNTAEFYEPDLGEELTATVFLVPKQVYNKKEYLNFDEYTVNTISDLEVAYEINEAYKRCNFENKNLKEIYEDWIEYMGGKKNVELRYFLSNFKFA
jgi:hypothetical protein